MLCPRCRGEHVYMLGLEFVDSEDGGNVRRDCRCDECGELFETWECFEKSDPEVAFALGEIWNNINTSATAEDKICMVRDVLATLTPGV